MFIKKLNLSTYVSDNNLLPIQLSILFRHYLYKHNDQNYHYVHDISWYIHCHNNAHHTSPETQIPALVIWLYANIESNLMILPALFAPKIELLKDLK